MRIPVIRQLAENNTVEELEAAVNVLSSFTEARGVKDEELNIAGDFITDALGAIEVKQNVEGGMKITDALNGFAKKVLGSIDR